MKHFMSAVVLFIFCDSLAIAQEVSTPEGYPNAASSIESEATYTVVSRYSGKCLDIGFAEIAEGASLQVADCDGSARQQFKVMGGYKYGWRLQNAESELKLRIADFSEENGAKLEQSGEASGTNGYFRFYAGAEQGTYTIINTRSSKCIDIEGPSKESGASVHQWSCIEGHASQEWIFVKN